MLILLYGPDDYRRKQKIDELRANFRAKGSAVLEASFDLLEKDGFQKFRDFISSPSLFYPFRVAVVSNAYSYDDEKALLAVLKSVFDDASLVCILSEEKAPRKSLAVLTKKPVLTQQFRPFTHAELQLWILSEAKKRGVSVSKSMMQYLELNYSSNLWGIITELDSLALQKGKNIEATREHDLLGADFFALASNLRPGASPRETFPILEVLLEREDPARIFNFLAYRARPEEKPRFADYDVAVKSGKLDYDTALVDVLIPMVPTSER